MIGRSTAFKFKNRSVDPKAIGTEFGVRYVLEGSVQRDGNRVRVNAQLIDAGTGAQLWADRFEEDFADLFKLQEQVVGRLAYALSVELIKADASKSAGAQNPDTVDDLLRGRVLLWPPSARDKITEALAWFDRVLAIEPDNAGALAGSAQAFAISYAFGWIDPKVDYGAVVVDRANRAIRAAPNDYHGYFSRSLFLTVSGNARDGLRTADAGLAMSPNSADLWAMRSCAESYLSDFEAAKSDVLHAMQLSPHDASFGLWSTYLAYASFGLGQFAAAVDEAKQAIDARHGGFPSYLILAAASALNGDAEGAKAALAEARRLNPMLTNKYVSSYRPLYARALDALRKAGLPEQ